MAPPHASQFRAEAPSTDVVLVGCGAVAERFYAPTLRNLENDGRVRVRSVIDPNTDRARLLSESFRASAPRSDMTPADADLVIVASPPRFHAEQTIDAMRGGAAVLVEKPMALDVGEAQKMLDTARECDRLLAVGLFRRFFSSSQAVKEALESGLLGEIESVRAYIGNRFRWPAQSDSFFRKEHSGGGVMMDIGVHVMDLLLWWFGEPSDVEYRDDAAGGVEANCRVDMRFGAGADDFIEADVRLSSDWKLANRIIIDGERGWLSCGFGKGDEMQVGFRGMTTGFDAQLRDQRVINDFPQLSGPGRNQARSFAAQLDNVLNAINGDGKLLVPGEEGIRSLEFIERCYAERLPLRLPWQERDLRGRETDAQESE